MRKLVEKMFMARFAKVLAAWVLFVFCKRIYFWKSYRPDIDPRPVLAFGGSGHLWPYYMGIFYYIKKHFETDHLRVSGISGGCISFIFLGVLDMDLPKAFEVYCLWIMETGWPHMFTSQSRWAHIGAKVLRSAGVRNKDICSRYNQHFAGVTSLNEIVPKHMAFDFNHISTLEEVIYLVSCSCCVFPFFYTLGYYRSHLLVDGGYSNIYTIPADANLERTFRVSAKLFPADITPPDDLPLKFVFMTGTKIMEFLIVRGYEDMRKFHYLFKEKSGLKEICEFGSQEKQWEETKRELEDITIAMQRERKRSFNVRRDSEVFRSALLDSGRKTLSVTRSVANFFKKARTDGS